MASGTSVDVTKPSAGEGTVRCSLTDSLDLLSDTYNYNLWVYSLLRPHLGESILEVGAGVGNITRFLLPHTRIVCLEPGPAYAAKLRAIAGQHRNLEVVQSPLQDAQTTLLTGGFDTVICINVLEHIEDDAAAVKLMLTALKPGGRLLLYVPACSFAFGALDASLGHFRRYSKSTVRRLVSSTGSRLVSCRSVNLPGLLGWFWSSRVMGHTFIDPAKARFVDRLAPYLSAMERIIPPPIGQSIFAVIRK